MSDANCRIKVKVVSSDAKYKLLMVVSCRQFKTVSDVQYHLLSLLDINVSDSSIKLLIDKYVVPPSESAAVFRDNDEVELLISPIARTIHVSNDTPVRVVKVVKKDDKKVSKKDKTENNVRENKIDKPKIESPPRTKQSTIAVHSSEPDVSSIWSQLNSHNTNSSSDTNANPKQIIMNVPTKKRKYPLNNEELRYNYEKSNKMTEESNVSTSLSSQGVVAPTTASTQIVKKNVTNKSNDKINYNLLPVVADFSKLMAGDEIVLKFVKLCERTFTPTLSQFVRALVLSMNESQIRLKLLKVDRQDNKSYFVNEEVTVAWGEISDVKVLKKFVPPPPTSPPPLSSLPAASSVVDVSAARPDAEVPREEEEVVGTTSTLYDLFYDVIEQKKSALSASTN